MAHRRHNRHHRIRRRRHNPFGVTGEIFKDAAFVTAGAVGSPMLANFLGQSGWLNVAATAGAAIALSFGGKVVGGPKAQEEVLKGGLAATIVAAIKQAGFGSALGLGSYVPSYFSVPTASDVYGRVAGSPYPMPALPAPANAKGMGRYTRFRSRYA